ncbi:MAG: hypothetical protein J6X55_14340 [Victivallales bacterium]|nr:hypothetical protein [Victivallales bacterium]
MNTIGLDLGTGAIKGVCWNPRDGIIATASERIPFLHPHDNWAELDSIAYRDQVLRIIRQLASASNDPIDGMAFAAASGNTMLCAPDGTPRTNIISWLDKRLDWRPPEKWNVRQVCGWPGIPTFPLMHLEYFRREMPECLASSVIAMNNDWLCWLLCGRHALDYSNGAPFYLFDQRSFTYHQPFLAHYGVKEAQLPEMLPSGTTIGTLKPEYADGKLTTSTRIVAGSFDHPAGARAAGVTKPGDLLLSCGTSWVGFYAVQNRDDVPAKGELCDTFQAPSGGCWGAMFSVSSIGLDVEQFICERFGNVPDRYASFNEEAKKSGSPSRAKMQEVVGRFKVRLEQHSTFKKVTVSGGPSEGETWPEVMEEVLGIPVELSPYRSHTGAVGAAMLARDGERLG